MGNPHSRPQKYLCAVKHTRHASKHADVHAALPPFCNNQRIRGVALIPSNNRGEYISYGDVSLLVI